MSSLKLISPVLFNPYFALQNSFKFMKWVLVVIGLVFSQQNIAASDDVQFTQKPIILWVSQYSEAEQDLALKGFNYTTNNQFEIDFISVADFSITSIKNDYQYLVSVSDPAWHLIKALHTKEPKIGIGVSSSLLKAAQEQNQPNQYLIGKEQPSWRFFTLLKAMNLNHTQAAALFEKSQLAFKLSFINQAEALGVPFKPISISHQSNTIQIINSVHDCCRALLIKQEDFQGLAIKQRSLFYESYRRKIITIGDREEMLKLGAMYSLYSEPHQLGQQAADLLLALKADEPVAAYQEPRDFVINSNHKVRSIIGGNLAKVSIGDLTQQIKLTEITNNKVEL